MILKCKICGGSLNVKQGERITECEYCGVKQTIPGFIEPKTQEIYNRASAYLMNNEFDKAENLYNQILFNNNKDADVYWNVLMCRYGVTYVKDPASGKYIPTCNRTLYASILNDEHYQNALKYADEKQKALYIENAQTIDNIQKRILSVSKNEKPFDVFICYKETDSQGRRTPDSVLANDLYHQLTQEGFKVFFARITLEDKLGQEYEPYIFAALNSAKVMVVMGTSPECFDAVWVKNEWSRFLTLIKNGADKILIPAYRDMDPYDLPAEFANLQAQDMSRLGFMQDLIHGIRKIVLTNDNYTKSSTSIDGANIDAIIKRAFMSLNDGDFKRADSFAEQVLNIDPENAQAYLVKLMASLKIKKQSELGESSITFENNDNYKKLMLFAGNKLKSQLQGYLLSAKENEQVKNIQSKRKLKKVAIIMTMILVMLFVLIIILRTVVMPMQKYNKAMKYIEEGRFEEGKQLFAELNNYKDSEDKLQNFLVLPKKIVTIQSNGTKTEKECTYDIKGNITKTSDIDEYGSVTYTNYSYDKNGNIIKEEQNGSYVSTTEYSYDESGNITKYVFYDEDGYEFNTEYVYDEKGNCIKHIYNHPGSDSYSYDFSYDENGNCINGITFFEGDPPQKTEYVYDDKNICIKEIMYDDYSKEKFTNEYVYNNEGYLIKDIGSYGTLLYTYDENGNCIKKEDTYSASGDSYITTYTFDEKGNCTLRKNVSKFKKNATTLTSTSQYFYDENGNRIKESYTSSGPANYHRYLNEYTYDEYNNCVEEVHTDNNGEKSSITYEYEYQLIYIPDENTFKNSDFTESYIKHDSQHFSKCLVITYDEDDYVDEEIGFMNLKDAINYAKKQKSEGCEVLFGDLVVYTPR